MGPNRRFKHEGEDAQDGTFMAFEALLEAREGGSTTLRYVHNGFLGDDWEEHYDALRKGDPMYLAKLATYLRYFTGQISKYNMFLPGQAPVADKAKVWSAFTELLGAPIAEGAAVRLAVPGLDPVDGTVEAVLDGVWVVIRTEDGYHTLMHGFHDAVVTEYHAFTDIDTAATEQAWSAWLAGITAGEEAAR